MTIDQQIAEFIAKRGVKKIPAYSAPLPEFESPEDSADEQFSELQFLIARNQPIATISH